MAWELFAENFIPPLLGAGLPILLGAIFLRQEKRLDRFQRLHEEKRKAYSTYIEALGNSILANALRDDTQGVEKASVINLMSATALVYLYAPGNIEKLVTETTARAVDRTNADLSYIAKEMQRDLVK